MITWNRRQEVLRSLEELTRLPERPPIFVVDNGSTDGTAAAVKERFPQAEVLSAGGNVGAAARTLGVRHVTAPYVALCDDDVWWEPGALARAADLFDRAPRLAVATARVLIGPQNEEDPVCRELEASPLPREPGMPGPPLLGFLGGASVVRRSAFLEAGGFEPRFFIGGEEELLAFDLAARGWRLCYVPELVAHHHPSDRREVARRRWHLVRNTLWSAWLRRPLASAVRKTVWMARAQPWDTVDDSLRRRHGSEGGRLTWRATMHGFAAALAGLPWVLSRRRVLPDAVERKLRLLDPPLMHSRPRRA
jgi:GT2 family glycosyltransferase